jgi:4-hydroxybenzoate polyprenyltransferase
MMLLRFMRLPNLVVIFLTMLGANHILFNAFGKSLSTTTFQLLTLTTILIAIGGNLINDLFDQAIDRVNKPKWVVVGKHLSAKNTAAIYFIINALALGITYYLFSAMGLPDWALLLYPSMIGGLFLYSYKLKCWPFVGNICIAVFCALVPLQLWWALITEQVILPPSLPHKLMHYTIFAFILTLWRELVKDLEDMKGDAAFQCKTLPLVIGEHNARKWALGIGGLSFALLCFFIYTEIPSELQIWAIPFLLTPNGIALYWLTQTGHPVFYQKASLVIKLLMLLGLVFFAL